MDLEGFEKFCADVGNDDGNVPTIFKFIDTSGDGFIQFDEWIVFVLRAKNPSFEDYAQLVIDLYDEDNSGTVSKDEVRKLALAKAKVEGRFTPEREAEIEKTIESIFEFADSNGDGELSFEELVEAVKKDPSFSAAL
jgi:Ca2+-binding EF-hand superfamily protein